MQIYICYKSMNKNCQKEKEFKYSLKILPYIFKNANRPIDFNEIIYKIKFAYLIKE